MFIHLFIYYCVSLSISIFFFVAWWPWCSMHVIVHVDILGVRPRIMPRARYILEKLHEQSCNTKGS